MPVAVRDNPPDFDVHQASTVYFYLMIANPCYNSLVTWDNVDHNKMVPDLAKRWEVSADGLTYTFYLEEGVKWHDGAPFTAEDVKYSLERQRYPPKGMFSANLSMLEPLKSVEVVNPYTVKIQLSRPSASFLTMMGIGGNAILPKSILEKKGDMKREVVGTGAWKLKKFMSGVSIELEKNPEYFKKGLPYMDGITQYIIADPSSSLAAFRTGRVLTDFIAHDAAAIDTIERTMSDVAIAYRIRTSLTHRNPYLNQTRPPFNDVRVRQAFGLALDRWEWELAVEPGVYAVGGYMQPGGRWTLPDAELHSMPGYAKTGPAKEAEREKAKRLLAEAGYPSGFELEIQARNLSWSVNQAVWLTAQLAKIGIKANIKPLETATYFDSLRGPGFQVMASGAALTADDPDAVWADNVLKDGGKNYGKYYNLEFEKLFNEQSTAIDPAKRKELVHRMHLILHDTVPFHVLGWKNITVGVWKKVKGHVPWTQERYSSAHRHEYTWLDPKLPPF